MMQRSWQRDLAQEIHIQRSCTRGPTGSWCRHPAREILDKRSTYRALAQEVLQDPDADILTERSWTRDPHTEILHKRSYRILMQRSWQRDLAQEIHIQRSCTSGPTGSWCREPDREILDKRSSYRDLAQVVLEAPHTDIPTQTSCTRDPHTEILHKWSYYRILAQRSWKSDTRDPHTEILHKWSYRILMQRSWQRHLAQEILIQRSCTGGPRGSSYRHPDSNILHKRSSYSDLAQVVLLQDLGAEILKERYKRPAYRDLAQVALEAADAEVLTKTSCRSSTTGFWCTDLDTDLASTISNKKTPQHCLGSLAGIIFFAVYQEVLRSGPVSKRWRRLQVMQMMPLHESVGCQPTILRGLKKLHQKNRRISHALLFPELTYDQKKALGSSQH